MNKVTFGIIGLGNIAQSHHIPDMVCAPHIHLKTVCDLNEDLLGRIQTKYSVPCKTTNYKDMLNDPEIQGICIATKDNVQAPLTIDALRAGKHVYVEKPLAKTAEECRDVVQAEKQSGKYVAVGFNRRCAPAYKKAKEIIWAHGGPKNIHYRISDPCGNVPERTRVITEVCHIFDILRFFTESEIVSMYCLESRANEEIYAMKFASGCIASITATSYATRDVPKERLEIFTGQMGGIMVEDFVELRTYGFEDVEHVYKFAGQSHPDHEFTHKYLFQLDGANALHMIRRMGWELETRFNKNPDDPAYTDNKELAKYIPAGGKGTNPRWNYMVDKGWLWYIDTLAQSILAGKRFPELASSEDAWKASLLAHAAIKSRDTGELVKL